MAYRLYKGAGIPGVPPAPLIGERLEPIDFDFMKIKDSLRDELPLLTIEQIMEQIRSDVDVPNEMILGKLMLMGFQKSASEIGRMMREDAEDRERSRMMNQCPRTTPKLVDDKDALKLLASVLSDCEIYARKSCWKENIVLRLELAEYFCEIKNLWIAKQLVRGCVNIGKVHLRDSKDPDDRAFVAESHLTMAFLLYETFNEDREKEVVQRLRDCLEIERGHYDVQILKYTLGETVIRRKGIVQITLQRPIGLHGWADYSPEVQVYESLDSSRMTIYETACILSCQVLLNNAKRNEAFNLTNNKKPDSDQAPNPDDMMEQAYLEALKLAMEGGNHANLFIVLYEYGNFLCGRDDLEKAKDIFLQLRSKSNLTNNPQALGVACNCLGFVANSVNRIPDAVDHLCEEYDLGGVNKLPALRIESLRDLGQLLLEEGHVDQAEAVCWEAYYTLQQMRKKMKTPSENEQTRKKIPSENEQTRKKSETPSGNEQTRKKTKTPSENEPTNLNVETDALYNSAWAMSGITTGQALWGRYAGHSRQGNISGILKWQLLRTPMDPVEISEAKQSLKLITESAQKLELVQTALNDKFDEINTIKELTTEKEPHLPNDYFKEWSQQVDDDMFKFENDKEDYRNRVMEQTRRMNQSMTMPLSDPNNALRTSLSRKSAYDVRSINVALKVSHIRKSRVSHNAGESSDADSTGHHSHSHGQGAVEQDSSIGTFQRKNRETVESSYRIRSRKPDEQSKRKTGVATGNVNFS